MVPQGARRKHKRCISEVSKRNYRERGQRVTRLELGGGDLGLERVVDGLHELIGRDPVLALHVCAVDAQRQVLRHHTALDNFNANLPWLLAVESSRVEGRV